MGKLVQMRRQAGQDPLPECVGRAMREAREVAGLDPTEAARRLNDVGGTSIIGTGLLLAWEAGKEIPDAVTFIRAVRLASEGAAHILAALG